MVDTYMLMIIGVVMMVMGSLFWMVRSMSKGRAADSIVFFGGVLLSIVILLYLLITDNNILTDNIPLVIRIRVMTFILGLMLTFSVLLRCFPIMDKIQVILDKFGLNRNTRMNYAFALIFLVIVVIVTIIIIQLM